MKTLDQWKENMKLHIGYYPTTLAQMRELDWPKEADELADILFVVVCIANQTGIDLTEAIQKNLNKKSTRDNQRHWNNPKLTNPKTRET